MRRRNQAIWPQEHAARAKAVAPEEHCLTSPGIRRAGLAKKTSQRVDVPWQRLFVDWMRFQLLYLGAVDDNSRHPPAAVEVDLNNHVQIIRVADGGVQNGIELGGREVIESILGLGDEVAHYCPGLETCAHGHPF